MKTYLIEFSELLTYKEYIQASSEQEAKELFFDWCRQPPVESKDVSLNITETKDNE